ncbi:MAG TPA: sigma-70 family RNA polymerase sigma factor [Rhizomicrobium sp.]
MTASPHSNHGNAAAPHSTDTVATGAKPESDETFKRGLLELIPFLRAFARSLCGNPEMADDLAQETLVKAWQARGMFAAGTNLKAWLFTILRNQFYSDRRRAWRQAPWDQDAAERIPGSSGEQSWAAELSDTARALTVLSDEQREALILVGAGGFSYEDAAAICKCAVGTVKSRVARARKSLLSILEGEDPLPSTAHATEGDAAHDIMAQLDRLAPAREAAVDPDPKRRIVKKPAGG